MDQLRAEYSPEERVRIYHVLSDHRADALLKIAMTTKSLDLYPTMEEIFKRIANEPQLPEEMRGSISEVMGVIGKLKHELMSGRDMAKLTEEQVAELVIADANALAKPILPKEESFPVTYEAVPLKFIKDELLSYVPTLMFLPNEPDFGYKGGVARVALKLWARRLQPGRFPQSTLDAEIPLPDFDAIVGHRLGPQMYSIAEQLEIDYDGIEERDPIDHHGLLDYMSSRDLNVNEALLTCENLYFTPEALEGILSGVVECRSKRTTLFGIDWFWVEDRGYLSSRAMHREFKMLIERKSLYCDIRRYNFDVHLLNYWFVLVRKWLDKERFPTYMAKLFDCAMQTGQNWLTRYERGQERRIYAHTPMQFLRLFADQYSSFDFGKKRSLPHLAKWICEKYYVTFHRWLRAQFGIHLDGDFPSTDRTLVRITVPEPELTGDEEWELKNYASYLLARKATPRYEDRKIR